MQLQPTRCSAREVQSGYSNPEIRLNSINIKVLLAFRLPELWILPHQKVGNPILARPSVRDVFVARGARFADAPNPRRGADLSLYPRNFQTEEKTHP